VRGHEYGLDLSNEDKPDVDRISEDAVMKKVGLICAVKNSRTRRSALGLSPTTPPPTVG
jgi:hypothetical protein